MTINVAVLGAGFIGSLHAENVALHTPGANLALVADPVEGVASRLAERLGTSSTEDINEAIARSDIDAVIVATPARFHTSLTIAASAAGKAVFVEKPAAVSLEQLSELLAATGGGPHVQVGFNRRFSADFAHAKSQILAGAIGTPQQLRSLTRDPGIPNPGAVPPHTIFIETLIHDFDTLNWFNEGAEPIEVYAQAATLAYPDFAEAGLQDTAVVQIRYDNGAFATAEASFWAKYGYDIRGEVFGSEGLVEAGRPQQLTTSTWNSDGFHAPTSRVNLDLFRDAYRAELAAFVAAAKGEDVSTPGVRDAERALAVALAAVDSARTNGPVRVARANTAVRA